MTHYQLTFVTGSVEKSSIRICHISKNRLKPRLFLRYWHSSRDFSTLPADNGSCRTFRMNNVNPGIPAQELQAAVDKLLAHDIMSPERGALLRLQSLTANTVMSTTLLRNGFVRRYNSPVSLYEKRNRGFLCYIKFKHGGATQCPTVPSNRQTERT